MRLEELHVSSRFHFGLIDILHAHFGHSAFCHFMATGVNQRGRDDDAHGDAIILVRAIAN